MIREKAHYATTRRSSRNYRVFFGGELLLESSQAIELREHYDGKDFESVIYFPAAVIERLDTEASGLSTFCPIKCHASYLDFRGVPSGIWYYANPVTGVGSIRGHVAFDPGKGFRVIAARDDSEMQVAAKMP